MKKIIFGAIIIFATGYITASVLGWQHYREEKVGFSQAKTAVMNALRSNKKAVEQNQKSLQIATDRLVSNETVCDQAWWVSWQTVIPALNRLVDECKATATKQAALKVQLSKINLFLANEHEVTKILNQTSSTNKTLTDKTWGSTIKVWTQIASKLQAYKASQTYKPVVTRLLVQVNRVLAAWEKIKIADTQQNKTSYINAYDNLNRATTNLISVANTSDAALTKLLEQASSLVNKL
jgi:hypothetical protein